MNSSNSLLSINENRTILYSGVVFLFMGLFMIPLYYIIIRAIYNKDVQARNVSYKLMNIVNILQLGQGLVHFVTAPVLIFPKLLEEFDVPVKILGCILNSFWIAELPVMALLSVSRIFIFCNKMSPKTMHISIEIMLFLIFSWTFFLILAGCLTLNLKLIPPMWGYDFDVPYALLFETLEVCLCFPCLLISYMGYLTICYLIYWKRNSHSSVRSIKNEIGILLQSTFAMAYTSFLVFLWHPIFTPFIVFFDMTTERNQAIVNGLWIFNCYVNPIMMLVFRKTIRDEVIHILGLKSRNQNNQTTIFVTTCTIEK